jgi:hypothetical protein
VTRPTRTKTRQDAASWLRPASAGSSFTQARRGALFRNSLARFIGSS